MKNTDKVNNSEPRDEQSVSYEIVTSFDNIDSMREEWDNFILSVDGGVYFSYDWCKVWWNHYHYKRKLKIFIFRDNREKIVGILPMVIDNIWLGIANFKLVKFISSDSTLSILYIPVLHSYFNKLIKIVFLDIFHKEKCHAIWFGPISGYDESINRLRNLCDDNKVKAYIAHDKAISCHTIFHLPEKFNEYLSSISKSSKKHYNGGKNRLIKKRNATFESISDTKNILEKFDELINLHTKQWQGLNQLGHFHDWPGAINFHKNLIAAHSEKNRARIIQVSVDHKIIAFCYCYFFGKKNHGRITAREPGREWNNFQLGTVSFVDQVKASIDAGISAIDGGQGHYDYKLKLGAKEYELQSTIVGSETFKNKLRVQYFLSFSKILNLVYYKLWFCRLSKKLPINMRRPLWKIWIRTRI